MPSSAYLAAYFLSSYPLRTISKFIDNFRKLPFHSFSRVVTSQTHFTKLNLTDGYIMHVEIHNGSFVGGEHVVQRCRAQARRCFRPSPVILTSNQLVFLWMHIHGGPVISARYPIVGESASSFVKRGESDDSFKNRIY